MTWYWIDLAVFSLALLPDGLALVTGRIPRLAGAASSLWLPLAAQRPDARTQPSPPGENDRHPVIKPSDRPRC
ncbi:hypothetical protein ACIF8W_12840 [Streptomyces sp. NPDC085639]|uniref:hypothetical protein n=1 Tax=Streptomyces sp. NPDC085639 TaxID=3365734 RepID=UPI0037D83168